MSDIRAIETCYKGYRFRSRLEARWAVFFESLGLAWEYEAEGFELTSGRHLPDFWMPGWLWFVEIKPNVRAAEAEDRRFRELCVQSGRGVLVIIGNVGDGEHPVATYQRRDGEPTSLSLVFEEFCECHMCHGICLSYRDGALGCFVHLGRCERPSQVTPYWIGTGSERIAEAYMDARSARFEFGESGAPR